jgi:hypothetical protein
MPGVKPAAAVAGLLACGAALGVAELLAAVVGGQASPLVAVGRRGDRRDPGVAQGLRHPGLRGA